MLYLLAAILGSSSLVIILKLFADKGVDLNLGIAVNYVVGAILALVFSSSHMSIMEIWNAPWLWAALLVGVLFSLSFVVYALSAQRSGVAVTTIFGRAAVVIPVAFAFLFLDSDATPLKLIMLAVILVAMYLILRKGGNTVRTAKKNLWVLLPVAVFLFNGVNDTLVQYSQDQLVPQQEYMVFTGVMFIAGAMTSLVCYRIDHARSTHSPTRADTVWGALLGLMNWVCMVGVFHSLDRMDGSVFYPLYYTGAIIISTLAGIIFFRERLSLLNYAGIVIAATCIAILGALG